MKYKVTLNNRTYEVEVEAGEAMLVDEYEAYAPAAPAPVAAAAPAAAEGKEVLSPLEGKFYMIKNASDTPVKVGDEVKEGDVLCYVEAMKTYNAVRAEFAGKITAICFHSGDAVSEDDVLMTIQ